MYFLASSSSSNSFDHVLLRCSLNEASRWAFKFLLLSYEEFNWTYWPNCHVKSGVFAKIYMSALKNWRCLNWKDFCKYLQWRRFPQSVIECDSQRLTRWPIWGGRDVMWHSVFFFRGTTFISKKLILACTKVIFAVGTSFSGRYHTFIPL